MKKTLRMFYCHNGSRGNINLATMLVLLITSLSVFQLQAADTVKKEVVSLSFEKTTLREVLASLESQTNYVFFYNHKKVNVDRQVSINLTAPVSNVLNVLFSDMPISYERHGRHIVLKRINRHTENQSSEDDEDDTRARLVNRDVAQVQITGQVTDADGTPIPGVNIIEKGTANGTVTDGDGQYKITADSESTLVFSFIGYLTSEKSVAGQTLINVALIPDVKTLQEVVVVGYGTQKKSSVVASISSVTAKEISALPVPSVEQALQGRAAGVVVTNNGAPGEAPLVRIRGINSINYASNPLYVVDGIVGVGNFTLFNSKDIESVEVLKDASSAAIYGSRASAGVVLVTTKKGSRDGKIHVNVDSYMGFQKAWKQLDLLKRDDYLKFGTALLSNSGSALPPRFSAMNDPIYAGSTQTFAQTETDWQKAMFRTARIAQTDVSLSGGNDKSRFFASAGYFKQQGIMQGTSFERYSMRINSDHQISKRLTIGQTLFVGSGSQLAEQSPGGRSQVQNMIRMTPYIPIHNPTNIGGYGGDTGADASDPQNPLRAAVQDKQINSNVRVLGNVYAELDIIKGLKYRSSAGADFNTSRGYAYAPVYSEGFNGRSLSTIQDNRTNYFSPIFTNQMTYDNTFGKHYINATGVVEFQKFLSTATTVSGTTPSLLIKELNSLDNKSYTADRGDRVLYSYIGRLTYEYANRYLLSASYRKDGYSVWAPGHKFGTFPSVGLGWRVSEENFMKSIATISELKVRGSWGIMGNPFSTPYPWQSVIQANTQYPVGGTLSNGAFYNKLANPALKWELTRMTNVGVDIGLFQNKFTLTAEYYDRVTDKNSLLLDVSPAPSTGYSQPSQTNIGSMRNWGYDFQAGYSGNTSGIRWNVSGNVGAVKNKILRMDAPKSYIDRGNNADFGGYDITRTEAGHAVQSFYGWKTDGIYQSESEIIGSDEKPVGGAQNLPLNSDGTVDIAKYHDPANIGKYTRPGDIRFKDVDKNGTIDPNDKVYLGSFIPKLNYGLNLTANYKGFDLTVFFQGVYGNKIYNGVKVTEQGMLRLFNSSTDVLRAWTPTNTHTDVPRAINGDPNNNTRTSDRFIESGSYLRLKNLSIGYSVPKPVLQAFTRNTLNNFRIYVSSQNLFTITKYSGYDPEIGSRNSTQLTQGIDYGQFPQARTIMFGIQAGF